MGSHSGGYGGYQSPMVKQELAKLDKGGDKRRSAMVSLRSCVENLDASTMPRFLAQISDTRDVVSDSRTYAISLYQDVARVHGKLVVPHIPRIMATVIRSLSSSGSSIHLHEACAKVVASIPRYAVDATSGAAAAETIFYEVCTPLMDVLLGKIEPLAAGAAICLQAVVESEKWKLFAPQQLVGDLCSKCNMALRERTGQTVGHLHLARALVKAEAVSAECGISFLRAAKEVLRTASSSWQHRAAALQLVRALMLSLDRKALDSESESIAQIVEQIRLDRMPHVRNEAVKALQALKARVQDGESSPMKAMSFPRDGTQPRCRTLWDREDVLSATSNSQESHLISCSPPPASSKTSTPDSSPSSGIRRSKRYGALLHSRRTSSFSSSVSSEESFTNVDEAKQEVVANPEALQYEASDSKAGAAAPAEADADHCVTVGSQTEDEFELTTIMAGETAGALMNNAGDTPSHTTPLGLKLPSEPSETTTLTAEDFIRFSTPRRLVRSLQALVSSPDASLPDTDSTPAAGSFDMQLEASSETGWSVRDNPIAEEHHRYYDSHHNSKLGYGGAKTLNPEPAAEVTPRPTTGSAAVEAGTAGSSKTGSPAASISKLGSESRRWHKARACIELALGFCLCFVLLVPLLLAMVQVFNARASSELHALVPT